MVILISEIIILALLFLIIKIASHCAKVPFKKYIKEFFTDITFLFCTMNIIAFLGIIWKIKHSL